MMGAQPVGPDEIIELIEDEVRRRRIVTVQRLMLMALLARADGRIEFTRAELDHMSKADFHIHSGPTDDDPGRIEVLLVADHDGPEPS